MKTPDDLKRLHFTQPESIKIEKYFDKVFDRCIVWQDDDTILWRSAPMTLSGIPSYNGFDTVKFTDLEKTVISELLESYGWDYEFIVDTRMTTDVLTGNYEIIESKIKFKPHERKT
jgi:hypothetical protein